MSLWSLMVVSGMADDSKLFESKPSLRDEGGVGSKVTRLDEEPLCWVCSADACGAMGLDRSCAVRGDGWTLLLLLLLVALFESEVWGAAVFVAASDIRQTGPARSHSGTREVRF